VGVAGRWLTFIALTVLLGTMGAFVVLRRAGAATTGRLGRAAACGLAAALVMLPGAAARLAAQLTALGDPTMTMPDYRALAAAAIGHTQWGHMWTAQVVLAVVAAVAFVAARRGRAGAWLVAGVTACLLAATPALAGHAIGVDHNRVLVVAADILHVIAAGTWVGTLAVLAVCGLVWPIDGQHDAATGMRIVDAFSPVALTSAALIVASGTVGAWAHLGTLPALWQTYYGRVLVVKVALVMTVLAAGAFNWRRATPRLAKGHGLAEAGLVRAIIIELTLGALVLGATAVLVASPLPGME
jgi:putative copper export protein